MSWRDEFEEGASFAGGFSIRHGIARVLRHVSDSARCRELVLMGKLERRLDPVTGKEIRRLTRSGRTASVLFAAPLPPENGPSVASSSPCHD